ncbi:hypothetical protein fugu_002516 [Takifugu bimaculatus]|uniref:Uncharacterized protein n=1 Tax=Takifugu bimaculatus TaxID=433685 RepID=A0A4Z2BSP3_9TELE|nr:hypothetical protein fugu_002516 [Takifugu bimaculatus]
MATAKHNLHPITPNPTNLLLPHQNQEETPNPTNLLLPHQNQEELVERSVTQTCLKWVKGITNLREGDQGVLGMLGTILKVVPINLKKLQLDLLLGLSALSESLWSEQHPVTLLTRRKSSASRYRGGRIRKEVKNNRDSPIPKCTVTCSRHPRPVLHKAKQPNSTLRCPKWLSLSLLRVHSLKLQLKPNLKTLIFFSQITPASLTCFDTFNE